MKIVSFNVNGIRSRRHQLEALRERHDPDVVGIQESKVADEAFPREMIEELGYVPNYFGQKSHYGVAFLSKQTPLSVTKGFPDDAEDAQRRVITASFATGGDPITVVNGYFPQGESRDHPVKFPGKRRFYADMLSYLTERYSPDENLVVLGDMNVAPLDLDIGIGADNAKRWLRTGKCSFLPEEREWLQALTRWGLHDAYRTVHPDADDRFSWFDYRSRGFERDPKRGLRIDLLLVTAPLRERLLEVDMDYGIRAIEKPSDHCPVWATFEL
ncbi:MAG: exodeoxyribonuclease III [Pseudomonadota bacterium]|nr:exodeoxyribonuclease III [Pseudomonadota bacterium]